MGQLALPALTRALQHFDNHVRWHAACILGRIDGTQAIPTLVEALENEDSGVRWLAGEALVRQEEEILEPLLQNLVHKPINAFLRGSAIHVLGRFQRKGLRAVAPLLLFPLPKHRRTPNCLVCVPVVESYPHRHYEAQGR